MTKTFSDLRAGAQAQFAALLREVCGVSGLSQGRLARMAQADYKHLLQTGALRPSDPVGSLAQPTISRILAGVQPPTYGQVFIFLRAIHTHYMSPELARRCEECGVSLPAFSLEREKKLWKLASFCPPAELAGEVEREKSNQSTTFVALPPKQRRGWVR